MKKVFLLVLIVSAYLQGHAQLSEHDFSFSATGDQQIALGRYAVGNAINILCQIEGGWAEAGGNYEIVSNWNSQPRTLPGRK